MARCRRALATSLRLASSASRIVMGELNRDLWGGELLDEPLSDGQLNCAYGVLAFDRGGAGGERDRRGRSDRGDSHEQPFGGGIQAREALLDQAGDGVGHGCHVQRFAVAERALLIQVDGEFAGETDCRRCARSGVLPAAV